MRLNSSVVLEEKSSEKTSKDICPVHLDGCSQQCAWNQGDFCIMFDLRNDLAGIRAALEKILQNMVKER